MTISENFGNNLLVVVNKGKVANIQSPQTSPTWKSLNDIGVILYKYNNCKHRL